MSDPICPACASDHISDLGPEQLLCHRFKCLDCGKLFDDDDQISDAQVLGPALPLQLAPDGGNMNHEERLAALEKTLTRSIAAMDRAHEAIDQRLLKLELAVSTLLAHHGQLIPDLSTQNKLNPDL